jgi:haloalkane dehalogenase
MGHSSAPLSKTYRIVGGRRLAYADIGTGSPIVLLHGNPTSSYLWRNVVPHLAGSGRIIVPDLIGHGDSDKLPADQGPDRYSFATVYADLDGLLSSIGAASDVTLVLHDWGSALGFHWACNNPHLIRGIAYMEGVVAPLPSWDDWPQEARGIFQAFRSAKGEDLILNRNLFIEAVLPASILRQLSDAEMAEYRAPFAERDNRQATLNWPRQLPIAGEPKDMVSLVQRYADWMQQNHLPKLFINAEPGSILVGAQRAFCRTWHNQTEVTVSGRHFIQEDSPDEIGRALAGWIATLP